MPEDGFPAVPVADEVSDDEVSDDEVSDDRETGGRSPVCFEVQDARTRTSDKVHRAVR
jgi:hypothetical protein